MFTNPTIFSTLVAGAARDCFHVPSPQERILVHCARVPSAEKIVILQDWLAARERLWSHLQAFRHPGIHCRCRSQANIKNLFLNVYFWISDPTQAWGAWGWGLGRPGSGPKCKLKLKLSGSEVVSDIVTLFQIPDQTSRFLFCQIHSS